MVATFCTISTPTLTSTAIPSLPHPPSPFLMPISEHFPLLKLQSLKLKHNCECVRVCVCVQEWVTLLN